MMFLEEGVTDRRQSPKVKQWVLLGMRMGMVGLLAVALARPIVRGQWGGLASGGRFLIGTNPCRGEAASATSAGATRT